MPPHDSSATGPWQQVDLATIITVLAGPNAKAKEQLQRTALQIKEILPQRHRASDSDLARAAKEAEPTKLFGTSGIRGKVRETLQGDWLNVLVETGDIDGMLACHVGMALAKWMQQRGLTTVNLIRDTRISGPELGLALVMGVIRMGVNIRHLGISPTPTHILNEPDVTVVLTASHNPPDNNGIKIFVDGKPLSSADELEIEALLFQANWLWERAMIMAPADEFGTFKDDRIGHEQRVLVDLRAHLAGFGLRADEKPFAGRVLPLDFACGAMACARDGWQLRLSPHVVALLELGAAIVGYGLERHGEGVNYRCGAAYLYGETDESPADNDAARLALGQGGYGEGRGRWVILPTDAPQELSTLRAAAEAKGEAVTLSGLGSSGMSCWHVLAGVDLGITPEQTLPALAVDGDGDRMLITAAELKDTEHQLITGDHYLRLLIELLDADKLPQVIWTYESDLSIAKHLEARNAESNDTIDHQVVNVGDRNVIERLLQADKPGAIGAEPSGHVMLADEHNGKLFVIDDPLLAWAKLIGLLKDDGYRLTPALRRALDRSPHIPCVRKPEAWGPTGELTPNQKAALVFSLPGRTEDGDRRFLSPYAMGLVPFLVETLVDAFNDLYPTGQAPQPASFADEWQTLQAVGWTPSQDEDLVIAGAPGLRFRLRLTSEEAFGPDVCYLMVAGVTPDNREETLAEVVLRNSGTRPKNAGYIKLWPIDPRTGNAADPKRFREIMARVALDRVGFTDGCVLSMMAMEQLSDD